MCVDMPGAQWWCKCGYAWCSVVVQVCVAMPGAQWWCKCVWICLVLSGGTEALQSCPVVARR